ncbi:uncharacterized protein LOC130525377 isoform X2 [Takifugu flavidus]|uniref:uncharacterized protein LOC130525377 isoform X2 n=1 Tax=Takifugu flavidus TaxID=433684 RepID=UPI0025449D67|nr:uncharacterized protein LOC130525377 isoform X2 [Takifugu flavidus]
MQKLHNMPGDALAKSVLKIDNGKFITIRKFKSEMMLCAVDTQEEYAPLVDIWTKETRCAFRFCYESNWYWMKVVANSLQFEKDGESEPFWFEREDPKSGDRYALRFVHESKTWYLSMKHQNKSNNAPEVLTITEKLEDCVEITEEKREPLQQCSF